MVLLATLGARGPFRVKLVPNRHYFCLGTPEQVTQYQTTFLLDLDGTLVTTDAFYVKVWNRLLSPYGLSCDDNFFATFIKGKSDMNFLKYLMPDVSEGTLSSFSESKDVEFVAELRRAAEELERNNALEEIT